MANKKHESPHILAYIMEIDKAIRNGEFPNASSMNKKMGWTISRSTFLRYMDILRTLTRRRWNLTLRGTDTFTPTRLILCLRPCWLKVSWYLLGYSHSSNKIRTYAMPRIRKCEITERLFSLPKDFKLENHIAPEIGVWTSSSDTFTVEIEFESRLKTFVSKRIWHKDQILRENADGSVYLSFKTNQLGHTVSWVLSFAGEAKILNPPELKKEVAKAARRILNG